MNRRDRHNRPRRRNVSEASYDEASRARQRVRAARPGGSGTGGTDSGLSVTRRFFSFLMGVVGLRLVWLQVVDGPRLAGMAESQRTNKVPLYAKRGTIYDRSGNVLAMSVECKTVYANPKAVKDPSGVAALLAKHLGGEKADYMDSLTKTETTFVYLKKRADESVADALKEGLSSAGLDGVYFLDDVKRVYPYGNVGAQVLGMVGDDGAGLSGLEYQYNDALTGVNGEMLVETGLNGTPIAGGAAQITEAQDGQDLVISIDADLQQACEEFAVAAQKDYESESASIMVTDPRTGEILAACSTPLPDFSNLQDNAALSLKLVSSSFEPGSVFKVLTTSIGLELGLFTPDSTYFAPVQIMVGDDWFNNTAPAPYDMDMDVREMVRRSSNPGMVTLVRDVIGAERFSEGVAKFGIGRATGIDFPGEVSGIVKDRSEYDGATALSMSFGQALAIPLVQLVRAYSAVANGGVPTTPHFLVSRAGETVEWPEQERILSQESVEMEKECMRAVLADGTGANAKIEGFDIAGKTGTGEQATAEGGYGDTNHVASMCGFANADDPEVLVYVGVNGTAYLSVSASVPFFKKTMEKTLSIMGVTPSV